MRKLFVCAFLLSQFFSTRVMGVYEFGRFCKKMDDYRKKPQSERDEKSIIRYLEDELYCSSGSVERDYELDEKIDVIAFEKLLNALKLDQSTTVNVVSAKSMIGYDSRGLSSPDDYPEAKRMIELAIREGSLSRILSQYFSFENDTIRERVIRIIKENWGKSEVFQDMVITMFDFAKRRTYVEGMEKAFIGEGEESNGTPGRIYLKGKHYFRSAFPGIDFPMLMSEDLVFFHEVGHSIDYNFPFFNGMDRAFGIFAGGHNIWKWDENDKLDLEAITDFYSIVAKFVPTKVDESALNSSDNLLKVNGKSGAKKLLGLPEARSKILYDQITEVWQILGIAYIRYGNVSRLYVNAMSDLALCLDMGLPIRIDHRGGATVNDCSRYEYIKFDEFNIELYRSLFELLGSSLEEYLSKLEKNAEKDETLKNYVKELRKIVANK